MSHEVSRRGLFGAGGIAALAALPALSIGRVSAAGPPPGELVVLDVPLRVYDSRSPAGVLGGAKLAAGGSVAVTVSGAFEGGFATAVFVNVTITDTEGAGYLVVRAEDLSGTKPVPTTSNINWATAGQTLANLTLSAVGGENAIEVICRGAGRTHVIVDVQGYVPFVA